MGIQSLESGYYQDAILSFRHGLECVKSLSKQQHQQQHCCNDDEMDSSCGCCFGCYYSELVHVPLQQNDEDEDHENVVYPLSPHNQFQVYKCAYMPLHVQDLDQVQLSIVLFYNMALAHQLAGLSCVENNSKSDNGNYNHKHLRESQKYYKISLSIVRSTSNESPSPSSNIMDCFSLVLGILNNMGFLYWHFCETDAAQSCSRHLDQMLESTMSPDAHYHSNNNNNNSSLTEEQLDFFYTAVTHTQNGMSIAPAA